MCNGQAVSRTTYSDLFDVINTMYGNGDGSTTFNVPDMRGRFPLGLNNTGSGTKRVNRTPAQNLGGNDGQEYYELQLSHMPSHNHTATISSSGQHSHSGSTTGYEADHSHTTDPATSDVFDPAGSGSGTDNGSSTVRAMTIQPAGGHDHTVTVPTNSSSHSHPVVVAATAAPTEHENTPQ
jgi:microcystin-dependent protein